MNPRLKRWTLGVVGALGAVARWIPFPLRRGVIYGLMMVESRAGDPAETLRRLFRLQDDLELVINERSTALGGGEHPKHRLMDYHGFFVERIPPGSRVLDVGCGYGAVARTIARSLPDCQVLGVELDEGRYQQALAAENPPNLAFFHGDALRQTPPGPWNVVVLSNVLEHIDERVAFLQALLRLGPERILIRVPLFERHWQMPLRRELGVSFLSDPTHFIEHTWEEFHQEMTAAGLDVAEILLRWGEIWADCRPASSAKYSHSI
ncbi:MAG: class I SAM-dependent methyltransferase [Magnetococcales bacterium]|nr:class I SAM-dependent methyltransferase [Magnetococcales bacterium]